MSPSVNRTFACPTCRAEHTWRAEVAGKPFQCRCGATFIPPVSSSQRSFDVVQEFSAEFTDDDMPGASPKPLSAAEERLKMYGRRQLRRPDADDESEDSPLKSFWIPAAMIATGVVIWFGQAVFSPFNPGRGVGVALLLTVFLIVVNLAAMLAAAWLAARLLSLNFGSPAKAAIKLLAIAFLAGAVFALVASFDPQSIHGPILAWNATILIYWMGFHWLFDLDLQETLLAVAVVALMQAGTSCIILKP